MKLSELPRGCDVFVDANIFLYHFHAASQECRAFVRACERGDFRPLSSAETLVEVAHRAMLAEAVRKGLATPKTVVRKLKERPELLAGLTEYRTLLRQIRAFLTSVIPATAELLDRALDLGVALRLLTRDSILVAALETTSTKRLATADQDFARLPGIEVYSPSDVRFTGA
jgi:predicted nucleic acid-binding protein